LTISKITASKIITCNYKTGELGADPFTESLHYCDVKNDGAIITKNDAIEVYGKKPDKTVQGFRSFFGYFQKIPSNLARVFPNLIAISMSAGNLEEINRDDLKGLPDLKYLIFIKNNIKVLYADTFIENPQLVFIDISLNKIAHIDASTFDRLSKLIHLDLSHNVCVFSKANNRIEVDEIIQTVRNGSCLSADYEKRAASKSSSAMIISPMVLSIFTVFIFV
jgi:hypothetical protein